MSSKKPFRSQAMPQSRYTAATASGSAPRTCWLISMRRRNPSGKRQSAAGMTSSNTVAPWLPPIASSRSRSVSPGTA